MLKYYGILSMEISYIMISDWILDVTILWMMISDCIFVMSENLIWWWWYVILHIVWGATLIEPSVIACRSRPSAIGYHNQCGRPMGHMAGIYRMGSRALNAGIYMMGSFAQSAKLPITYSCKFAIMNMPRMLGFTSHTPHCDWDYLYDYEWKYIY